METMILASASPRRREILQQVGIPFEVIVSNAQETITKAVPGEIVEELSCCKAQAVRRSLWEKIKENGTMAKKGGTMVEEDEKGAGRIILGADTVVVLDGQILGKPKDAADARRMLQMLQGRTHQVYTGVTLICKDRMHSFHEKTDVTVYPMDADEIEKYVLSGDCMDKAGAYGIQGAFAVYIQGICGDYYNVVGLPVGRLWQELKRFI